MQLPKLPALSFLLLAFAIVLVSCEKDAEKNKTSVYTKNDIPMTGAQVVPGNTSAAVGSLNVYYSRGLGSLTYTFTWTGLSDTIKSATLWGPAPVGYGTTTVKQVIPGFSDFKTNQKNYPYQGGSYTGSVVVDNVVIKEQELLNHLYYITLNTKTYTNGEIRGQVRFQ